MIKCLMPLISAICFLGISSPVLAETTTGLQDPMKPPAIAIRKMRAEKLGNQPRPSPVKKIDVKPPPPLVLQSILFSNSRQVAIINEESLVKGDQIDGARIVSIDKDRVTLTRKGKKLELMLDSNSAEINKTMTKSEL